MKEAWNLPVMPKWEVSPHGFSFARDVNATFVNCLSDTQLRAVLDAYEAGKCGYWDEIKPLPPYQGNP